MMTGECPYFKWSPASAIKNTNTQKQIQINTLSGLASAINTGIQKIQIHVYILSGLASAIKHKYRKYKYTYIYFIHYIL